MAYTIGETLAFTNQYDAEGVFRSARVMAKERKVHFDTISNVRRSLTKIEMELHSDEPSIDLMQSEIDAIVYGLVERFTNADMSLITAGLVFGGRETEEEL